MSLMTCTCLLHKKPRDDLVSFPTSSSNCIARRFEWQNNSGTNTCLLLYLAQGRLFCALTRLDPAFGKSPGIVRAVLNHQHFRPTATVASKDNSSRAPFVVAGRGNIG